MLTCKGNLGKNRRFFYPSFFFFKRCLLKKRTDPLLLSLSFLLQPGPLAHRRFRGLLASDSRRCLSLLLVLSPWCCGMLPCPFQLAAFRSPPGRTQARGCLRGNIQLRWLALPVLRGHGFPSWDRATSCCLYCAGTLCPWMTVYQVKVKRS